MAIAYDSGKEVFGGAAENAQPQASMSVGVQTTHESQIELKIRKAFPETWIYELRN